MSIDTLMKRASAMNPACPWRGLALDPTAWGFADGRAAADYMYAGVEAGPPGGGFLEPTYFIVNCGRMMSRRGS